MARLLATSPFPEVPGEPAEAGDLCDESSLQFSLVGVTGVVSNEKSHSISANMPVSQWVYLGLTSLG